MAIGLLQRVIAHLSSSLMVHTLALPTIRDAIRSNDGMSTSVIKGIVIGVVVLISIPLSWCCYKLCHKTRHPNMKPVYVSSTLVHITDATHNHPSSTHTLGHISRPLKAHAKVNAPTSRAMSIPRG